MNTKKVALLFLFLVFTINVFAQEKLNTALMCYEKSTIDTSTLRKNGFVKIIDSSIEMNNDLHRNCKFLNSTTEELVEINDFHFSNGAITYQVHYRFRSDQFCHYFFDFLKTSKYKFSKWNKKFTFKPNSYDKETFQIDFRGLGTDTHYCWIHYEFYGGKELRVPRSE